MTPDMSVFADRNSPTKRAAYPSDKIKIPVMKNLEETSKAVPAITTIALVPTKTKLPFREDAPLSTRPQIAPARKQSIKAE